MSKKKTYLIIFFMFPPIGYVLYILFIKYFIKERYFNYINFILKIKIFKSCIRFLTAEERFFLTNNLLSYNYYLNQKDYVEDDYTKNAINELNENGYFNIGICFTEKECNDFQRFLENKSFFRGVVPMQSDGKKHSFNFEEVMNNKNEEPYLSFLPEIITFQPIKNFLSNKKHLNLFNSYLKFDWDIFSVITWFNPPTKIKHQVHSFHRDNDDFKTLAIFISWTDTNVTTGALNFIESSHRNSKSNKTVILNAKKGNVFIVNSHALHSGNIINEKFRIKTQIRLGKLDGYGPTIDGLYQAPSKFECNFLNKNLIL